MMAKPIKALELHYSMIQFLIIIIIIYKAVVFSEERVAVAVL